MTDPADWLRARPDIVTACDEGMGEFAAAHGHVAELKAWEKRGRTGPKPQWNDRAYITAGLEAAVEKMVKMGLITRPGE